MNEREQQYLQVKSQPKNDKYVNGSVGAGVRGDCLPVRCYNRIEWKYDDDIYIYICVCACVGPQKHRYMCF